MYYNNESLSEQRAKLLNSIEFDWNSRAIKHMFLWMDMYKRLVACKKKHNSFCIPKNCEANNKLSSWVMFQRHLYKNNRKKLPVDRINYHDSIDFVWDVFDAQWTEMYNRLVEYNKLYKSTKVPYQHKEDPEFGRWVQKQKSRKSVLSKKRLELLNKIDFSLSTPNGGST